MAKTARHTGTVKWFDEKKSFGFIHDESTNRDIFVHYRDIIGASKLVQNQKVTFEVMESFSGPKAINVQMVT